MSNCVTNFEMSNILPGKKPCQDKNNESQVVQTTPIKKSSFTYKNQSSLEAIVLYAELTQQSKSSAIAEVMDFVTPILEKCNRHNWSINEIKNDLLKFSIRESINLSRGKTEVTLEEYCSLIWKTNIISPLKIPIADYFQLNANDKFMGKDEKTVIRERLSSLRENYDMEKAIYIYNQRHFNVKNQSVSGYSNIILIHRTTFEDYYFDVGQALLLPTSQLIIFGINEVLRRKRIVMPYPVVCWIDIYHVNDMTVMLPVLRKTDASYPVNAPDDIIINPYSQESRT
ncbi:hypothetical protein OLL09_003632 [Escherichia coli]|nr:hypothetical protein [Escherichia coli]